MGRVERFFLRRRELRQATYDRLILAIEAINVVSFIEKLSHEWSQITRHRFFMTTIAVTALTFAFNNIVVLIEINNIIL